MSRTYRQLPKISPEQESEVVLSLLNIFSLSSDDNQHHQLQQELRRLSKLFEQSISQDVLIHVFRQQAGQQGLPELNAHNLQKIRLKPMRSQSGVQTVSVLTKPFPCPGQCIFCPNDIRMPKSYIASEPGAQRAERNSFDPYLQTYSRLTALTNMGHQPSKIELIVLGGTWSYYPESYQIWFIHECFRALNEFGQGIDSSSAVLEKIKLTVASAHRQENRVTNFEEIEIDGLELPNKYNQVINQYYLRPELESSDNSQIRRESKSWEELENQHKINESGNCRCVGLTIETRPDNISEKEVRRIRRLGCTKTQIGFQSLSDKVLDLNKRGHKVEATKRAVKLLRQAGFKIHAHWMPNLYGSDLDHDRTEFLELFEDPDFMPDELKIYPCALIPSAELMQYYQDGRWKPYTTQELQDLLAFCLTKAPEWVRLNRVVRDIPSQETATNHLPTNLRQLVQDDLTANAITTSDIRAREIRQQLPQPPITLNQISYKTSSSEEIFLQYVDVNNRLLAFLRLSLPNEPSFMEELEHNAIIRELHVYGQVEQLGQQGEGKTQHRGYGKKLINSAKKLATEKGFTKLSVISAIGTREYYRKQGFDDGVLYQHCSI